MRRVQPILSRDLRSIVSVVHVCMAAMLSLAVFVLHGTAMAQEAAPQPTLGRTPSLLWGFLLMAVLLVAVIMVSIMPSKRSHQD